MAIDVEKYRKRLLEERDNLLEDVGSVAEVSGSYPTDSNQDVIEAAQHGPVIDVERQVVDMKSDRLEQLNAALDRIDEGSYGVCDNCGKQIDPRRLDAEPVATTCIDCQSAQEQDIETPKI